MSNHNVLSFGGAMDPRKALPFISEAKMDEQIKRQREQADDTFDPFLEFERREYRQSVIPLKPSLAARLVMWLKK